MMKQKIRVLALFAALVLVCLSATGCNAIDEMRENHGYYTKTGSIMLGDVEYLSLPVNEYFSPSGTGDRVYITDADVPVLLSNILGKAFAVYNDGVILSSDIYGKDVSYCRKDKHAEITAQLEGEFKPTDFCYSYSYFDTKTESYTSRNYLLTEEQKNAVRRILATVEGVERVDNAEYTYDHSIALEVCTHNMLLRDWQYDIQVDNGTYYLVANDLYVENGIEYTVPSEYNAIFKSIMAASVDSEKAEQEYWDQLMYGDYVEDTDSTDTQLIL